MAYPLWYVEEKRRRRWRPAAATSCLTIGWADLRRRAALLVGCVRNSRPRPSSRLARLAAGPSAGHGRFWDALLSAFGVSAASRHRPSFSNLLSDLLSIVLPHILVKPLPARGLVIL